MKNPKTFEDGLQRLQNVLEQMQDDNTTLDQSVKLYAEAAQLIRFCNDTLNKAKIQIDEIDATLAPAEDQPQPEAD
ncbi:MAG: exodeoxyribonuclease VII small subunit [Gemmiger sp.]|uniref:exodeoxyribonuclease VII small subunit n=1 Tax=Gemmiger sp. TaxID=2049027 RepID=UPI002E7A41FE|nr:exodeoxyribonuclease VII small subunit [Gemmiger sp.]MEE0801779.1 exodeoxyribonuclease VII small subunit [Gemmiger sp.]